MSTPAQLWLEAFIAQHGGVAGTVHQRIDEQNLQLAAASNIPPHVVQIIQHIPRGKGMAGIAFEQDEPVSTCNIKDDNTGRVRPGAKDVGAQAAVALPVHDSAGAVRAVVGIAYREQRELTSSELAELSRAATSLPSP
jgi:L-methionine (R)-S-oxide reductase